MPLPELTPEHLDALAALEWIHSNREEDRRTGRSTILAIHAIRRCLRGDTGRDGWVEVDDHADGASRDLRHNILRIAQDLAQYNGIHMEIHPNGLRMRCLWGHPPDAAGIFLGLVSRNVPVAPQPSFRDCTISSRQDPEPLATEPYRPTAWEHLNDS